MNQSTTQFACTQCDKVCKSKTGLSSHLRAHQRKSEQVNTQQVQSFACTQCEKTFKSKTGMLSHIRSHLRKSVKPVIEQVQIQKTKSILRNNEKKVKTNRVRIAEYIAEQRIIEMTLPQPIYENVVIESVEQQNEFQCIVCFESVQEIVKCPICIATYCSVCYNRCKDSNCAQCRQGSDLFVFVEQEESESESDDEARLQDIYQYWANSIHLSYNAIMLRMNNQQDRDQINYNRAQIQRMYVRMYKLFIQNAQSNNGDSIVNELEFVGLHVYSTSTIHQINLVLNRIWSLVYVYCKNTVVQSQPQFLTYELIKLFVTGNEELYNQLQ